MSTQKIVVLVIWFCIILFPPYWETGLFSDDIGWAFLFDSEYRYLTPVLSGYFFANAFSWSIFLIEVIIAAVVTKLVLRSDGQAADSTASAGGFRPNASVASPAAPKANLADELGKLNALRQSGALTDEEFAEEKAKLMGGPAQSAPAVPNDAAQPQAASAPPEGVTGESGETFPSQRIANAVAMLRSSGLKESQITAPVHKLAWNWHQPLPPLPYLSAEPGLFAIVVSVMGLLFAIITHLLQGYSSLWAFAAAGIFFGGFMAIFFVVYANNLRGKHNLPEWHQIPG